MTSSVEGRRRALAARFPLTGNGLELAVLPGTDPALNAAFLPVNTGLPARIAGRILLLRFVTTQGVAALTQAQVLIAGATVRWLVPLTALATLPATDPALQPDELTWFNALAAALDQQSAGLGEFLLVHTEVALPAKVALKLRANQVSSAPPPGFEPRLSSLEFDQTGDLTSGVRTRWLNGIDHVIVADLNPLISERLRQRVVFVRFANAFGVNELGATHFSITGGERVPNVALRWAQPLSRIASVVDVELTGPERTALSNFAAIHPTDLNQWVVLCTQERGDFSLYTLRVSSAPTFDPLLSAVTLNLKVDCPTQLDCAPPPGCSEAPVPPPVLDYLTRDFAGFRRLLFDRIAALGAGSADESPAGLASTLVELVAARADQLAYAQDSVATEAYLHTARLRSSVRRHARLLDYRMHEGVNSRAFVHLRASEGASVNNPVQVGDLFLTRIGSAASAMLAPTVLGEPLPPETQVFAALLSLARLRSVHNDIEVYTWGEEELCLPRGTTRCTLLDPDHALEFFQGDLVLLEAVASESSTVAEDTDPTLRHIVRLSSPPRQAHDALLARDVLELEWHPEDALPFDLPVRVAGRVLAKARGNMLLVDHGEPAPVETLQAVPFGSRGRLHARLRGMGLTHATAAPTWDDPTAHDWLSTTWSATGVVQQAPESALPSVSLLAADGTEWAPQRDLLASDRSASEFWVETESSGQAWIRFGDGTTGQKPSDDETFTASYRLGNGTLGNVGAGAIAHLLTTRFAPSALAGVRNPLPAVGGVDPEPMENVRRSAPQAFRTQERAVTLTDWAEVASRHREVQRAVARLIWTGSWHTVRVHVDRVEGRPVDAPFIAEMTRFLERFRLAGYDLEITGPTHVSLDIVLSICVAHDAWPEAVSASLREVFGRGLLADGTRAFFHPDNFTFGNSVYLSQIVARAMSVKGVRWVDARAEVPGHRFRRFSSTASDELASGILKMGPLEIPRCDSDPNAPERGRIQFNVEGGA
ncbi:hypothetical protein MYSTI_06905 [Myxococcus stipitatus DSM 14675]|uniref:Baseplate protein J-like domain-containing protein n=1 Tax=Myxococcus stipitatus (strain DSM 14675 / JCM 12634 / Mx s8) TaxID=1278073 RepID=L7UJJ5_MYXSD|nr:putative baseplate assembly protein [Myxococcus stipitatus]AGC48178.1 hypothetical protein MYSTI_06905 [Myxococcus stipitatus DSM 14675]